MIETQFGQLPEQLDRNMAPNVTGESITFERYIEKHIMFPFQTDWDPIRPVFILSTAQDSVEVNNHWAAQIGRRR